MSPVENFIFNTKLWQQEILFVLRRLILDADPAMQEKIAHGIPFFYRHGRLCYLHPKPAQVDLGFCRGAALSDTAGLKSEGRKEIKTMSFYPGVALPIVEIRQALQEAILLNDWHEQNRRVENTKAAGRR